MIYQPIISKCEHCDEMLISGKGKDLRTIRRTLLSWGWYFEGSKLFCCKECKDEYLKKNNLCQ